MRLIAVGGAALVQGFALLGAETYEDATGEDLERVLADVLRGRDQALIFVERGLAGRGRRNPPPGRRGGGSPTSRRIPPRTRPRAIGHQWKHW